MITKSQNDKREYRTVVLSNHLECLLISDNDTQKSAAAMVVKVGSFEDPQDRQGLAHFLEHMLFLGSEKYPSEGAYRDYINSNSGACNAYTSTLLTNYMFQVANEAFYGALDRFAQFFISPLFTQSGTEREMKAVDSEYNMNLKVDGWRKQRLMRLLAKKGHKYDQFQIGNLATLQFDDTRDRLLEFHKQWYSANQMKLVILGAESLDKLEEWAKEIFSSIENKSIDAPHYIDSPYEEYGKLVKFVPIKDEDILELRWIVEYLKPYYKNCPSSYLSHLLGHEGENSLLSLLRGEGLATELLASGSYNEMHCFSYQTCRIQLTKKGLKQTDRVIGFVFQYLEMLKEKGPQKWVFEEKKAVNQLNFDYIEKQKPFDYVAHLAAQMTDYPVQDLLKLEYFYENYEPELIERYVNSLRHDNLFVVLSTRDFSGKLSSVEEFFQTEYSFEPIPDGILTAMRNPDTVKTEVYKKRLDLPPHNVFIPQNTEIIPIAPEEPVKAPEVILKTEQSTLWFQRDEIFKVPRVYYWVRMLTVDQNFGRSNQAEILARLWRRLLDFHLRELKYLASQASLGAHVELSANGLTLSFDGFNDSIPTLVTEFLKKIKSFKVQEYEQYFDDQYTLLKRSLENALKDKPFIQIQNIKLSILRDGSDFTYHSLLDALKKVNFKDLLKFQRKWLKEARYQCLSQGNMSMQTAIAIQRQIEEVFECQTLHKDDVIQLRSIKLRSNELYNYSFDLQEPTDPNSSVLVHYSMGQCDERRQVLIDVLLNFLKTDFFEQLRTKEQLGYAVFSLIYDVRGVYGFEFLLQSNVKSNHYVQQRVREFLNVQMKSQVDNITKELFDTAKQSVRVSLLEKDYELYNQVIRNWNQIQKHHYVFNLKETKISLLEELTIEDLQKLFYETFIDNPRVLEIHANSQVHKEEDSALKEERKNSVVYMNSIAQLKKKLELYPDFYAM